MNAQFAFAGSSVLTTALISSTIIVEAGGALTTQYGQGLDRPDWRLGRDSLP